MYTELIRLRLLGELRTVRSMFPELPRREYKILKEGSSYTTLDVRVENTLVPKVLKLRIVVLQSRAEHTIKVNMEDLFFAHTPNSKPEDDLLMLQNSFILYHPYDGQKVEPCLKSVHKARGEYCFLKEKEAPEVYQLPWAKISGTSRSGKTTEVVFPIKRERIIHEQYVI